MFSGLIFFLLEEVSALSCCLNCTFVNASQHLSQFLPLNKVMGSATFASRDQSSYFFLLHLCYAVTCYPVHGSGVAGYGEHLQSLDLKNNTIFVGGGLKGTVDVRVVSFEIPNTVPETDYLWIGADAGE